VLAKSLYTHLLEHETEHYLRETRRVLRPGRVAVVTAFLFDPHRAEPRLAFPHAAPDELLRWRSRFRPRAAVAYAKARFTDLIESAGLHVQYHWRGYYPGSAQPEGQDILVIGY
jgi:hypothetical protein